jgi:hypothetical protein
VWPALSHLSLDTHSSLFNEHIVDILSASPYSVRQLSAILVVGGAVGVLDGLRQDVRAALGPHAAPDPVFPTESLTGVLAQRHNSAASGSNELD